MTNEYERYLNIAYQRYANSIYHAAGGGYYSMLLRTIAPQNIISNTGKSYIQPIIEPGAAHEIVRSTGLEASNFSRNYLYNRQIFPTMTRVSRYINYQDQEGGDVQVNLMAAYFEEAMGSLARAIDQKILAGVLGLSTIVDNDTGVSKTVSTDDEGITKYALPDTGLTMSLLNKIIGLLNKEAMVSNQPIIIPLPSELIATFTESQANQPVIFTNPTDAFGLETVYRSGNNSVRFVPIPKEITLYDDSGLPTKMVMYPKDEARGDGYFKTLAYVPDALEFAYRTPSSKAMRPLGASGSIGTGDPAGIMDFFVDENDLKSLEASLMTGRVTCAGGRRGIRKMIVISFSIPDLTTFEADTGFIMQPGIDYSKSTTENLKPVLDIKEVPEPATPTKRRSSESASAKTSLEK